MEKESTRTSIFQKSEWGGAMERFPHGNWATESRKETLRLAVKGEISALDVAHLRPLPHSTIWDLANLSESGSLVKPGENQLSLKKTGLELAQLNRKLAVATMELDIPQKATAYFVPRSRYL